MADTAPVSTAWRTRPADASAPRRRLLALLLLATVAVVGTFLGIMLWLSPPRPVALAPIWITTEPPTAGIPGVVPWTKQDRAVLVDASLLGTAEDATANPSRDQIRLRLKALSSRKPREPVVVVLSAPANVDGAGQVYLLGADSIGDHPRNRIALGEVLELVRACPAEQRLLVLDLWPVPPRESTAPPAGLVSTQVLAALDQVLDEGRLCLLSCDAGQVPLASPVLGRTVFGHYLEAGLRGAADGWNDAGRRDGRVSVTEAASYARAHVVRWSQGTSTVVQTPRLVGHAPDFTLHPATREEAIAVFDPPRTGLDAYPEWLKTAWVNTPRGESLVAAEWAWASGKPSEDVKREYEAAVRDAGQASSTSPVTSLAGLPGSIRDLVPKLSEELRAALARGEAAPVPAGAPFALWKDLEPFKTQPHAAVAAAAFAILAQNPAPSLTRLRQLDLLLTTQEPTPRYAETLLLRRLAELPANPSRTALLLRLGSDFEQAALVPAVIARARPALDETYRAWRSAQAAVFSPGYVSTEVTETRLGHAASAIRRLKSFADATTAAEATRREARHALSTAYPAFLAGFVPVAAGQRLADTTHELDRTLNAEEALTLEFLASAVDRRQQQANEVGAALTELRRPFTPAMLASLRDRAAASDATPAMAHELATMLRTNLLPASERPALWGTLLALEKRLSDEVTRLDRDEVQAGKVVGRRDPRDPAAPGERARDSFDRQQEWSNLELRARGVTPSPAIGSLLQRLERMRTDWLTRRDAEQQAITRNVPGTRALAWQAQRYEYEAHDPLGSGVAVAFATEAARLYRAVAGIVPPLAYLDFTDPTDTAFGPDEDRTQFPIGLRLVGSDAAARVTLEAQTLFPQWLEVSLPKSVELTPTREEAVRTELTLATPQAPGNGAEGVLLEATVHGWTFHHRVPMSLDSVVNRLQLVVSTDPKAAPRALRELRLRPHGEIVPYLFQISNPGPNPRTLAIRLATLGVETKPFVLAARGMAPLAFPAPPTPPVPPAVPGEPPSAPPSSLRDLTGPLEFEVLEGEGRKVVQRITLPVSLLDPSRYLTVTDVVYRPAVGARPNSLGVRVLPETPLDPPPCPVEVILPAEANPALMIRDGKLKGTMPPDGQALRLYADGLTSGGAPPTRLYINLNADGSERAFTFAGLVPSTGESVKLAAVTEPLVRVRAPEFASGIVPLPVRIEVDNAPDGSKLELRLGTTVDGRFIIDATKTIDTPRERVTSISVNPETGVILLRAVLRDWATTLPVDYLVGVRDLEARIVDARGTVLAESRVKVTFDNAPPANVEFLSLPPRVAKEKPLALRATSDLPVSGVKEVKFFLGKPVRNAPPQGAALVPAKLVDPRANVWEAVLPPPAVEGPLTVTAMFTSRAGLNGFGSQEVESIPEAELNRPEPGTITGKVVEGRLAQAGLIVVLLDDKGEKGRVTTKADGTFQFRDVVPGKYKLHVAKESTNRKADADVDLKAGETKTLTLELFL